MNAIRGYLLGCGKRREFWAGLALSFGLTLSAAFAPDPLYLNALPLILVALWLLLASRRLRAMRWSPWLSLAPIITVLAFFFALLLLARTIPDPQKLYDTSLAPIGLGWLAFNLLLGAWPSKSRQPPPATQAEVFG
ncbi:hypothetical protein SGCZBJ_13040 [Caulobacter zeae]|uniref:DUF805 domain-containing protein n=1 Tax=Caulobacter zeae TaxID=2055137 RepID=A0A2N5DGG5_9CAUL|nr:hypothetical protein [Caulobacter zeae]PLR25152.1 hypothetical protein SGCZBJ_13040 [Caulobacter zeae]